jgi:hypothetical protein
MNDPRTYRGMNNFFEISGSMFPRILREFACGAIGESIVGLIPPGPGGRNGGIPFLNL